MQKLLRGISSTLNKAVDKAATGGGGSTFMGGPQSLAPGRSTFGGSDVSEEQRMGDFHE